MKALTLRQPWAWAVASGHKKVENRVWAPRYRGPLLIHAGVAVEDEYLDFVARECGVDEQVLLREIAETRGRFVALCEFYNIMPPVDDPQYDRWAAPGQYRWMLKNIRAVTSDRYRGKQGLWLPEDDFTIHFITPEGESQ